MMNCFAVRNHSNAASFALFILRVVCGLAFMFHGFGKIQNPFHWMGVDSTIPNYMQFLAALAEFGGGLAWILGFLTPLASIGIAGTMIVAIYFHVAKGDPFIGFNGSYELAAVYLSVAIILLIIGPGCLSIDRKIFGNR